MRVIANTTIITWRALTFIDVDGAVVAIISCWTVTGILINPIHTTRTILTDRCTVDVTVVVIGLAILAFEAAVATLTTVVLKVWAAIITDVHAHNRW